MINYISRIKYFYKALNYSDHLLTVKCVCILYFFELFRKMQLRSRSTWLGVTQKSDLRVSFKINKKRLKNLEFENVMMWYNVYKHSLVKFFHPLINSSLEIFFRLKAKTLLASTFIFHLLESFADMVLLGI